MVLSFLSDPLRGAEQQWSATALGDTRRTRRAVPLGAALASRPEDSLPEQTGSWREVKAAYRLLNEPDVTHTALSEPHGQATRQQARQTGTVLFVQDTSDLDFTAHRQTKGLGWIGNTGGRMARKLKRVPFSPRVTSVTSAQRCYFPGKKLLIPFKDSVSDRDSLTADGYDKSRTGLVEELGYRAEVCR